MFGLVSKNLVSVKRSNYANREEIYKSADHYAFGPGSSWAS